MDQSDLDLLQIVPAYHLQVVMKMRHLPLSPLALNNASSTGALSLSSFSPAATLEIAQQLFDTAAVPGIIQDLGEVEAAALRELVACGGRANSRDLALYFTLAGLLEVEKKAPVSALSLDLPRQSQAGAVLQPPQYPPAHPHGVFEQALHHLLILGLVFWGKQTNFAGRDYSSGIHDGVVIVPLAVREAVRQVWLSSDTPLEMSDVGDGARELQRTLYLYWSLVATQREGLSLVNNGLLSRSSLRLITEHLGANGYRKSNGQPEHELVRSESDVPRLLFLRLLLMRLGLLQERQNVLYAVSADAFFSLPLLERVRRCYRLYLETPFWNELAFLPEVNVRPGPTPLEPAHEEVMRARQAVLERLLQEPAGEWLNLPAFIARTKLYAPYLLFPRQYGPRAERYSSTSNPYAWDFRLRRGWLTHREGWHMVEGGFIRTVLTGPLSWLGLLEVQQDDLPGTFCLSHSAGLLTGMVQPQTEEISWGRLIVQPNFELVALAPVSEALLVKLDRFAERVSLEHIAQYRITRASVTRAIQRGLRADTIQAVLEQGAAGEIPQNVRYSLLEWERQARRVEIWQRATLLEVDDIALLDSLFDDPETHALFGRRLTPTLVEVAPQQLHAVQKILWQRNYLPALTNVGEQNIHSLTVGEPQWHLLADGFLQPIYAVLDLYLIAEVERFSQRDEATSWYQLTSSSVRQALSQGIELEHILNFLQRYCEGGIPGSLLIRLKLWGGGYTEQRSIHVEPAPLLRLPTVVLQDLQADPELKTLLGPEVEASYSLVSVAEQNLPRILELLRERGFTIEE